MPSSELELFRRSARARAPERIEVLSPLFVAGESIGVAERVVFVAAAEPFAMQAELSPSPLILPLPRLLLPLPCFEAARCFPPSYEPRSATCVPRSPVLADVGLHPVDDAPACILADRRGACPQKAVLLARIEDKLGRCISGTIEADEKLLRLALGTALVVLALEKERRRRRLLDVLQRRELARNVTVEMPLRVHVEGIGVEATVGRAVVRFDVADRGHHHGGVEDVGVAAGPAAQSHHTTCPRTRRARRTRPGPGADAQPRGAGGNQVHWTASATPTSLPSTALQSMTAPRSGLLLILSTFCVPNSVRQRVAH